MDWTHTFTIIGALGAFIMYISSRTDRRIDVLEGKIEGIETKLEGKIDHLNDKIDHLNDRLNSFENQTNQRLTAIETILSYVSPKKVVSLDPISTEEEPKEN